MRYSGCAYAASAAYSRASCRSAQSVRCSDACITAANYPESATCATPEPTALNKAWAADGAEVISAGGLPAGHNDGIGANASIGINTTKQSSAQDSPVAMHST